MVATDEQPGADGALWQEGEYWTITFGGMLCRLRDSAGMRQLAYLLTHPDEPVDARLLQRVGVERVTRAGKPPRPDLTRQQARVNVTRALHAALRRIGKHHPALHDHLRRTLRTGYSCSYLPDSRLPSGWRMSPTEATGPREE